jgi:hypothetical protein
MPGRDEKADEGVHELEHEPIVVKPWVTDITRLRSCADGGV